MIDRFSAGDVGRIGDIFDAGGLETASALVVENEFGAIGAEEAEARRLLELSKKRGPGAGPF